MKPINGNKGFFVFFFTFTAADVFFLATGLPDGLFSNQKYQFGQNFGGL
jgi:hypothetical protein